MKLRDTKRNRALEIREEIAKLHTELKQIQDKCPHTKASKIPKSDTGNYDPSQDSYWYERFCPDCFKYWHEDQ